MKILIALIAALFVLYLAFVAFNTYLYHQKQMDGAPIELQWGF